MKKWYIDDVFVHEGRIYDRGYYLREDGMVEWREPFEGGRTFEFPVSECFHEDGTPVTVEDGELLGDLCDGWDTVEVEKVIYRLNDYPRMDEAYMIGLLSDGRYCFAWGPTFPYADRLPSEPAVYGEDGESGFSFYFTLADALTEFAGAVEAVEGRDLIISFTVPAKKYFEADAESLSSASETDRVIVAVIPSQRRANYIWSGADDNPANFPAEDDNYEAIVQDFQDEIIDALCVHFSAARQRG